MLSEDARPSPEAGFDRQWAVTALDRALDALTAEFSAQGKADLVERLRPWMLGESAYGDQSAVAQSPGLSASAMRATVHRLRSRFRQCVKAGVSGTLKDADVIENEMRALFVALGS